MSISDPAAKGAPHDCCPACRRPFTDILDYPRVRIVSFERLPLPEALDTISGRAAEQELARRRAGRRRAGERWQAGINMTPAIERCCNTPEVQGYLTWLSTLSGQEIDPRRLLPPLAADTRFRWAHPVGDDGIYLSLSESDEPAKGNRIAEVQVHCSGPNLGSAGGPTLQLFGAIARLRYQGLLGSLRAGPSS